MPLILFKDNENRGKYKIKAVEKSFYFNFHDAGNRAKSY